MAGMLFRVALRRATRLAELDGKISGEDATQIYAAIQRPIRRKGSQTIDLMTEVEDDVRMQMMATSDAIGSVAASFGSATFLQWLIQNLPMILQLIMALAAIFAEPGPQVVYVEKDRQPVC